MNYKLILTVAIAALAPVVMLSADEDDGINTSAAESSKPLMKAYLVSDAHLDTQWNWDVRKTIGEYIPKTLYRNLTLLEKYPGYVFNFEGAVKYAWMKEYYPEAYSKLQKYIDEGRWHISGASWDATDPNMPSSESFIRNIMYGQHFYEQEFGVLSTDIFLPDCFGFGYALPTVAAHCGLIGFSTQKLQWRHLPFHGDSKVPFEIGLWQGVDGSRIMAAADAHGYGTRFDMQDLSDSQMLKDWADKDPQGIVYHYYGTGDTGGSPSMESVAAVEYSVKQGKGPVRIISATSDQLFKDFLPFEKHPELPVYDGELAMDVHATGCYTSQAAMKFFNRKNEQMADAAERGSVVADWMGKVRYPRQMLSDAWKRVIWHQFHDDLTGTSIPRAYEFSWNDEMISLGQFSDVLMTSVGAVSSELDTKVSGTPVVVFNPSGFPRRDVVRMDNVKGVAYGPDGRQVPTQVTPDGGIVFVASTPALGYAVYDIRKGTPSKSRSGVKVTSNTIENSIYRLTLNSDGDISSIIDKRCGRELVEQGKAIRLAMFTDNKSFSWPAWEILKGTIDQEPVSVGECVDISIAMQGAVQGSLKVERNFGDSHFCQWVTLYEGADADRIDIINDVRWASTNSLLKAEFPLSVSNGNAVYDLGVGNITRSNNAPNKYEVFAHQWADLTDEDGTYGVSILNDCKYGWDKPSDNTLRLTLLHTPSTRNGYRYQDHQDFGEHYFTYSIIGHESDHVKGCAPRKAEVLNQNVKAFTVPAHKGRLGRSFSFVGIDNHAVALRALKYAEDSDAYVVRFYETDGRGEQSVRVSFPANIIEAKELNGNEKVIGGAAAVGKELSFSIKPFSIKTFLVRLEPYSNAAPAISSKPLDLPYTFRAATYNGFQNEGNIDGAGSSYAAELLPAELSCKGVDFRLGDPAMRNVVRCSGQKIDLPEGDWNRVCFLAAGTRKDISAVFGAGDATTTLYIPYFSGFLGQWGHTGHTEGFFKDAAVAYVGTHKHSMGEKKDLPYDFTYMFFVSMDLPAGARHITLPENKQLAVFAATVVKDEANVAVPVSPLVNMPVEALPAPEVDDTQSSLLSGRNLVGRSAEVNRSERASMAVDDNVSTKWCDNSPEPVKYIEFDLGASRTIRGWYVLHAGMEAPEYITNAFALQVRDTQDAQWRTVDEVARNSEPETSRRLPTPAEARFVRLSITEGDQEGGNIARIYEFSVY